MPGPESLDLELNPNRLILPGTTSGPGNIANPTGAPAFTPRKDENLMGDPTNPSTLTPGDMSAEDAASRGGT